MGLLRDALKILFYTNNSSAASSDARVPLLNADGTPKGSDTMANLASVLGAAIDGKIPLTLVETQSGDFNDMRNGFYYTGRPQELTNTPEGVAGGPAFCIYVGLKTASRGVQVLFSFSNSKVSKIFMRGQLNTGWTTWNSIELT